MSTKTKREPIAADFLTARELAARLGFKSVSEFWRRVRDGIYPLPHSKRSAQIYVWRRDWYDHFLAHGAWPEGVRFQSHD